MELSGVNRSLRQSMHARTQNMWVEEEPFFSYSSTYNVSKSLHLNKLIQKNKKLEDQICVIKLR